MEDSLNPTKTVFTISQFLQWMRSGALDLNPLFQRRSVWKSATKSQLVDSVLRGYPLPIILLRQVQDLETLEMRMEVVDGQQRIRTLLSYIDPNCLEDFDPDKDRFTISPIHNREFARKSFSSLPDSVRRELLRYELSTHIFPPTTDDASVYRIFARLNSTGLALNDQEVRNAEWHGAFKTLAYDLSFEHLDHWRRWRIFSNDQIARMQEVEAVSEHLMALMEGISAKSQPRIKSFYKKYDDEIPGHEELRKRFETIVEHTDKAVGAVIGKTTFRRPALFYSLFCALADHIYGLGSVTSSRSAKRLPDGLAPTLERVSNAIRSGDLPEKVQDAMERATGDKTRRVVRHEFLMQELGLEQRQ